MSDTTTVVLAAASDVTEVTFETAVTVVEDTGVAGPRGPQGPAGTGDTSELEAAIAAEAVSRAAADATLTTAVAGKETAGAAATAQAFAIQRANHTGTQAISTVTGLQTALDGLQPLDSDLTAIAALSTTSFGRGLLALADAAAGRTSLGLGTAATAATGDFDAAGAAAAAQAASQPIDSDLTAIAALTTTSYGRAFLALADASAGRTALGLGTAATSASSAFDAAGAAAAAQAASQPLDSDLTAIAALSTTSFGRSFLDRADAAAARTLIGVTALESVVDAKGDLLVGSANDTATRLAVGTAGQAPTPDTDATSGLVWGNPVALSAVSLRPTSAVGETVPRFVPLGNTAVLTSGRLYLFAIALPKGVLCSSITFVSGSTQALATGTNQWFGLFDSSRAALRLTNDDGATAWAVNTAKTLNLTSGFTTTYAGWHYVGIMVAATTPPNLAAITTLSSVQGVAPIIGGFGNTGQTAPPSLPFTASALTTVAQLPYAYIS